MISLSRLHEEFIDDARQPPMLGMSTGKLPVKKREADVPVIPVEKWRRVGTKKALSKTFRFLNPEDKLEFVKQIMEHEVETKHRVTLLIEGEKVSLGLLTPGVEQVTELDKEFASFADETFRDIVYSAGNEK